jgi:hypothetical protein
MVVDVGFFAVILLLVAHLVVVAVGQGVVVVLVGVPGGPVLELADKATVMVDDVVVVMGMNHLRVGMGALLAFALGALLNLTLGHGSASSSSRVTASLV